MRRTVDLDPDLEAKLAQAASQVHQEPAIILVQAVRVGLPMIAETRAEGYFAADYARDDERIGLEAAMAQVVQSPER
jgi:predicted transcriptional regulator